MGKLRALLPGKQRDIDMTEGSILRHLVIFSLPLLAGNIFQQLYNTVDTWVVGNYVSNEAFSAVGSVGPIINMLIGLFMGMASGAGVVISQFYGAKQPERVQDAVHTSMLLTLLMAVVFTVVGIFVTPYALRLMNTPEEVIPEARTYLVIYFSGALGLMVYNMGSGILRAVGDSQRPFLYLVVCTLVNTVLDLLFVIVFHMGVAGVALATILAQFVSAALVVMDLVRSDSCIRLVPRLLRLDRQMLKSITRIGFPSALRMAVTSFSNVFVQSYINHFGADCMSGWTAFNKIDQLVFLPAQSLSLAATTFVGQNLGINNVERAKRGVNVGLGVSLLCSVCLTIPLVIWAPQLTAFFNSKPEVVKYGAMILRYAAPFYLVFSINQIYSGALQGAGNSRTPMLIMLFSFVVFRQIYLYIMANYISNTFLPIVMGYPFGWALCSILIFIYYHKTPLDKTRVILD